MAEAIKARATSVLKFWFGEKHPSVHAFRREWFMKDEAFDVSISKSFGDIVAELLAAKNLPLSLHEEPFDVKLATVLCLDQFTRNIYRNDPRSFSGDAMAQAFVFETLERFHQDFVARHSFEQVFFLMPLMHSEDLNVHVKATKLFRDVVERTENVELKEAVAKFEQYEQVHLDVIEKYGRYPSRNAVLGRVNTPAEEEYLKNGGGF